MKHSNKYFFTEGKKPLWQIILAALFYTSFLIVFISIFIEIPIEQFKHLHYLKPKGYAFFLSQTLILGLNFSIVKNIYFDLDIKKFKKEYSVGIIKIGKWKDLPEIDYVSLFTVTSDNEPSRYDVNLWYKTNQHLTIYQTDFINIEIAFHTSYEIAKKLEIDLLNATICPYEWMNLSLSYEDLFKQIV
jgi:hypothetical protein